MITFPISKINLGLNVVEKRPDGYHNLETVFYPVKIQDALEVFPMDEGFPSPFDCDLKVTNIQIEGDEQRNLVVKAYQLLKKDFPTLPHIHVHLYKGIPTQAGMGGGSSDCGYMITLLNEMFQLKLSEQQMISYAAQLGADCAFFISSRPAYAEGIGEQLQPIALNPRPYERSLLTHHAPSSGEELPRHRDATFGKLARGAGKRLREECLCPPPGDWRHQGSSLRDGSHLCRDVGQRQQRIRPLQRARQPGSLSGRGDFQDLPRTLIQVGGSRFHIGSPHNNTNTNYGSA